MPHMILIVEHDPAQSRFIEAVICGLGHRARAVTSCAEAMDTLRAEAAQPVDLAVIDVCTPDRRGLEVVGEVQTDAPSLPIIILAEQAMCAALVGERMNRVADILAKPVAPERLRASISQALRTAPRNVATATRPARHFTRNGSHAVDDIMDQSAAMTAVIDLADRAAASDIPILIEGESGVGKERIARAIHGSSKRAQGAFVAVNCGAMPDSLAESLLFGHEKGSFTGATGRHAGKFLEASGGTLFLDEVGDLKLSLQVKLLRALQEGEVDPIGGNRPVKVDFRLVSATNRNLFALVQDGEFREDLYYRLNVLPIVVPPLRERRGDILALAHAFVGRFAAAEGKDVPGCTLAAANLLASHPWPGNVRQLENTIFSAVVLSDGGLLDVPDFPQIAEPAPGRGSAHRAKAGPMGAEYARYGTKPPMVPATPSLHPEPVGSGIPFAGAEVALKDDKGDLRPLRDIEEQVIRLALKSYQGRMSEVARKLGIGRSTLYRKVREFGLRGTVP